MGTHKNKKKKIGKTAGRTQGSASRRWETL